MIWCGCGCGWLTEVKSRANLHSFKMSRGDAGKEEKQSQIFGGTFATRF